MSAPAVPYVPSQPATRSMDEEANVARGVKLHAAPKPPLPRQKWATAAPTHPIMVHQRKSFAGDFTAGEGRAAPSCAHCFMCSLTALAGFRALTKVPLVRPQTFLLATLSCVSTRSRRPRCRQRPPRRHGRRRWPPSELSPPPHRHRRAAARGPEGHGALIVPVAPRGREWEHASSPRRAPATVRYVHAKLCYARLVGVVRERAVRLCVSFYSSSCTCAAHLVRTAAACPAVARRHGAVGGGGRKPWRIPPISICFAYTPTRLDVWTASSRAT